MKQLTENKKLLIIMSIAILFTVALSTYLLKTKPKARHVIPKHLSPLVKTKELTVSDHKIYLTAMGLVKKAQSIQLNARVSGEIVKISPRLRPGALFKKGEFIAQIDPTDFKLNIRKQKSELLAAQLNLELEEGKRMVAQREFTLLNETIKKEDERLILRTPHLEAAQANVNAAQAALQQTQLDLKRTTITAPFNAIIKDPAVAVGMQVNANSALGTLINSDVFWIEASLPINELSYVNIGQNPSKVTIKSRSPKQVFPQGLVQTITSSVESKGHMARIIIEVINPIEESIGAPLLLDDLVSLSIEGKVLKNVMAIPRLALHEGNRVWLFEKDKKLTVKKVEKIWADKNFVYISSDSIKPEQKLITTHLIAPVQGMSLREMGGK